MKRLILAALMTLAIPQQVMAANDQAAAGVNTPQVTRTTAATPASPPDATTPSGTPTAPAAGDPLARDLQPIVVSVPRPHIWTFRKGASTVLVLGMVYPEPEGLTYVPGSIHHAIAQSGAVIGPPWFHFTANVNLINVWSIWHAASGAKYLPDGKHLADILSPSELAQWNALKARYKPGGNVDRMRPMYAGWKLYEAVLKHSGVAVDASVYKLITDDARKRGIPMIDAQFHWVVKDPKTAAKAFEPSLEVDLACFRTILAGIESVPDSARTLAASWAVGDVGTMTSYLHTHTLTNRCWVGVTDDAIARQQGLNRAEGERKAWLAAFNSAAAKYPVVFTIASIQDLIYPAHQIRWLMDEGYAVVDTDTQPLDATTPTPTATATGSLSNRQGSR